MDIGTLRSAFSKGILTMGNDCITVVYPYLTNTTGWYDQEISDEGKELLAVLLEYCEKIEVITEPGKYIEIIFHGKFNIEGTLLYPPVKHELTLDDYKKIDEMISAREPHLLEEIFQGVDMSNNKEVCKTFTNWIDENISLPKPKPLTYQNVRNLKYVSDMLYNLPRVDKYSIEVTQTSGDTSGYVDIYVQENEDICIEGDTRYIISDMLAASGLFVLELNIQDGLWNASFFVD